MSKPATQWESCPHCGGWYQFDGGSTASISNCPHCAREVVLGRNLRHRTLISWTGILVGALLPVLLAAGLAIHLKHDRQAASDFEKRLSEISAQLAQSQTNEIALQKRLNEMAVLAEQLEELSRKTEEMLHGEREYSVGLSNQVEVFRRSAQLAAQQRDQANRTAAETELARVAATMSAQLAEQNRQATERNASFIAHQAALQAEAARRALLMQQMQQQQQQQSTYILNVR